MSQTTAARALRDPLIVNRESRPGWVTGADRVPASGETVFTTAGEGEVSAVLGKVSDGSRLLEIRLPDPKAKPFFAAASNVLVSPKAEKRGKAAA